MIGWHGVYKAIGSAWLYKLLKNVTLLKVFAQGNEPLPSCITSAGVFFFPFPLRLIWPPSHPIARVIHRHCTFFLTLPASPTAHKVHTKSVTTQLSIHNTDFPFLVPTKRW